MCRDEPIVYLSYPEKSKDTKCSDAPAYQNHVCTVTQENFTTSLGHIVCRKNLELLTAFQRSFKVKFIKSKYGHVSAGWKACDI